MGKLVVKPLSITQFVTRLETEKGFSFARYGDGTFLCLWGKRGINCDGVVYSADQARETEASIRDTTIYHGLGDLALTVGEAEKWLRSKGIRTQWYDANVMNKAMLEGRLFGLVKWLRKRRTVLCAASHLHRLQAFPIGRFVTCHPTEAFEEVDSLEQEIVYWLGKEQGDTVLLSAGQAASPVLVSRLHAHFPAVTVVDTGSIWDPFVGVLSRKSHREMSKEKIVYLGKLNFNKNVESWWKT